MINVAFIWHMHQPFYKDLADGKYVMPWVRLHGIKDYYGMASILDEFPAIRQTFNLVPSLILQLEDYAFNNAVDSLLEVTLKPAAELTKEDKIFILWNFFMAHWDNMIKIYPRYAELLEKRGYYVSQKELEEKIKLFNTQDFLDLQVLFNIAWFDPDILKKDNDLNKFVKKERKFSEEEKIIVISKQRELLTRIIPKYKELMDRKQIEITTTPFYHPILPLIYDTNIAKISLPDLNMQFHFNFPEDARLQVKRAIELHKQKFGIAPSGMWPAEGSVSEDIISVINSEGIKWIASDEEILMNSLNNFDRRENILYKPYKVKKDSSELNIIFRDKVLSDLIGFVYSKWNADTAVNNFVEKIYNISRNTNIKDPLISIILDGENAWEYYENNGKNFLSKLYSRLSNESGIKTVTVSEYLEGSTDLSVLHKLYPGSWINHNFYIWIGHEEDIKAWEFLYKAREDVKSWTDLKQTDPLVYGKIMEEIYIAEGSDWWWWYGDDHSSLQDEEFDYLFRKHLMNIYEFAKKDVPAFLLTPIVSSDKSVSLELMPTSFINPVLDGKISSFYEWSTAGIYEVTKSSSVIHRAKTIIKTIYFGFNLSTLFLRIDLNITMNDESHKGFNFNLIFVGRGSQKLKFSINPLNLEIKHIFSIKNDDKSNWQEVQSDIRIAALKIIEISIPFSALLSKEGDKINFSLIVFKGENEIERWPPRGVINIDVPNSDFESIMWHV